MRLLSVFLLLPSLALGQTTGQSIDSIWASPSWSATASVQLLRTDVTTGRFVAITGQTQQLGVVKIAQSPINVVFPGQKSSPMTVSGVRLTVLTKGLSWSGTSVIEISITPVLVSAGKTFAVRYDAPLLGKGFLQTAGGVTSIPVSELPGPVVSGPITPATASPPGSTIPPLSELVDKDGIKWTLVGSQAFRNGIDMKQNNGPEVNQMFVNTQGQICVRSPIHGYVCWNGTTWQG